MLTADSINSNAGDQVRKRDVLGIVGGLGPLASADFLLSIYERNMRDREQESPVVLCYSDPTFPDRTETFLSGKDDTLLERLERVLGELCALGATRLVVPCVTFHHLFPRLPVYFRNKLISLVELTLDEVIKSREPHLLLCTNGTRVMRIFESHEKWPAAARYVAMPDEEDQARIHELIYKVIKRNGPVASLTSFLESLSDKYEINSFIAGCTELHRVSRFLSHEGGAGRMFSFIDPLAVIAGNYEELVYEERSGSISKELRNLSREDSGLLERYGYQLQRA